MLSEDPKIKRAKKILDAGEKVDIAQLTEAIATNEKLDALLAQEKSEKKETPSTMQVELKGISVITIKGDKGDDGHTPTEKELIALIKPLIPKAEDGEDYVLTNADKKEIASLIDVPIIEKVIEKQIVEKPTITNEIKEVAKYEEAEAIFNKIKKYLKIDSIEGLDQLLRSMAGSSAVQNTVGGGRAFSYLSTLVDVLISNPQNGDVPTYNSTLQRWENKPSSSLAIGSSVTSGTPNSILFIDAAGKLAQDNSNFFYNQTTKTFTSRSINFPSKWATPTALPTATDSGIAGNPNGTYYYTVTFYNSFGETTNTTAVPTPVTVVNKKINLTSIPISPDSDITGRRIYRNKAINGDGNNFNKQWLVGDIPDNTTTTFQDNAADASLTVSVPRISTLKGFISDGGVRVGNYTGISTAIGLNAMATGTGYANTAIGANSLTVNIDGNRNTAIGVFALYLNTTGDENTAVGVHALNNAVSRTSCTAIGYAAAISWTGTVNTDRVTVVGAYALNSGTTTGGHTVMGYQAYQLNTTGYNNTGMGENAGRGNITGAGNVYVGYNCGAGTNSNFNAVLGNQAMESGTAGGTTALGAFAGQVYSGSNGLFLGFGAGQFETANYSFIVDTFGRSNQADQRAKAMFYGTFASTPASQLLTINAVTTISQTLSVTGDITTSGNLNLPAPTSTQGMIFQNGFRLLSTYGTKNTFVGKNAGNTSVTGDRNVGIGEEHLISLTSGVANVGIGVQSLYSMQSGNSNMAIGTQALYLNSTGSNNTGVGHAALFLAGGSNCVGIGTTALQNTQGGGNVGIGVLAGYSHSTGDSNMFLGGFNYGVANGSYNTFIGNNIPTQADCSNNIILADGQGNIRLRIDANSNFGINTVSFGGGSKVIAIANATAPSSNPSGGGILYVESGALKYRGSGGTVTTIAAA